MRFFSLLPVLAFLLSGGCAHMHIVCQDAGSTSLAVGGNTAGQQILSVGLAAASAAAQGAKFMAMTPQPPKATPSAQSQSFVDYSYLPVFGPDYASCNTAPPPQPPTTSIMFVSANGQVQVVPTDSHQIVVAPAAK